MKWNSIRLFLEYNKLVAMMILKLNKKGNFGVKCVYESKHFVDDYVLQLELQKPELAILEELRSKLPNLKMLDIGVGAGRTTKYFAGLVKEYVGIDYSSTMIKACRSKFPQYKLDMADARDLSRFKEGYFDFVMFSFNGIDAVEHEDRLAILGEIHRVTKKNGYFAFSTLNLNSWHLKFFRFSKNPMVLSFPIYNFLLNRKIWYNLRRAKKKPQYSMIYHLAHASYSDRIFLFRSYFVIPIEQIRQLNDAGFSNIMAYDLHSGKPVIDPSNMMDNWIYFLAKAK